MNKWILTILMLCVLIMHVLLKRNGRYIEPIPKHVYTYWESDNVKETDFVRMCMKTWSYHNSDWMFHVISGNNLCEYAPETSKTTRHGKVQKYADLIRLEVLERNGGVWLDASIYMTSSLNWIHDVQRWSECTLLGFTNPIREEHLMMESWFIACTAHNEYVREWRAEYMRSYNDTEMYLRNVPEQIKQLVENPEYLTMNVCWKRIHERRKDLQPQVHLMSSKYGPFKLQTLSNYNPRQFKKRFDTNKNEVKPFIKITQIERQHLLA